MCGITGVLNLNKKPISNELIQKMTDIVRYRGPDGEEIWTDEFVGFGHCRLAIIDLSALAAQPMHYENYTITYNGEVYNFQQIRIELEAKGYKFKSKSDTEVILKSYIEWGEDCVYKFNGMFAFAIWNKKEKKLFLARDRYGIKPLYYYSKDDIFVFASEIKSILQHPGVTASVSIPALNEYFSFQNIFSDITLFNGIKLLAAGSKLSIELEKSASPKIEKYWDYDFIEEDKLSAEEYTEELTRLFEVAVKRQLISDVEIGTYLSGGIDSGSVTCLVSKNFNELKTFTCGFDLSSASGLELAFDERQKAEYLSNLYKTEHYEIVLKAGDMERIMPQLIWHLEDLRVGQSYPNYYVSRLASKFVKVVLSGAGGDELFAGYPWRYYSSVQSENSNSYIEKYYKYWQRLIPDSLKPKFYQQQIYPQILDYQTFDVFKSVINSRKYEIKSPEEYINRSLYFEIKTFLHGLLEVEDKLSMAHGLEIRLPFLDNDLVDFAMKIPVKYKLNKLHEATRLNENDVRKFYAQTAEGKIILKKALSKFVPQDYVNGFKQGFSAPDASWFRGESIDYIKKMLFNKSARIYDYIQPETAKGLMNEHFDGKQNKRLLIWSLLCFEWWLKTFIS
jgi:asparagine synthase (glutamine-hydrolysing)